MKSAFRENVGTVDQWLRLAAGFVLLVLAGAGLIGPWGYLGAVLMLTAMVHYCPLYHALGIHSGKARRWQDSA